MLAGCFLVLLRLIKKNIAFLFCLITLLPASAQQLPQSVARQWNEVLLAAIRNDFAQPTVHARNLFHISAAAYDAWAAFEPSADTYFLGKTVGGYPIAFDRFSPDQPKIPAQQTTLSYAVYRLMEHRYRNSPGYADTKLAMDALMETLGYNINFFSTDYSGGNAAALGNYLAEQIIAFGLQDGANELGNYGNLAYLPVNPPLSLSGTAAESIDPNRWQPLQFEEDFIDQSGNPVSSGTIDFLSPEWGNVVPFSLTETDSEVIARDGISHTIYLNPGPPPYLDTTALGMDDPYKWGFALVAIWQGMLDTATDTLIDISPNTIGNINLAELPATMAKYPTFYRLTEGGHASPGYDQNPVTGQPYPEQWVPRGDYGRVLAEFWADGPDSETPPGHWYVILNSVTDHPRFERRIQGGGKELSSLEWDVKAYFALGGAMHDAAIAAWSVKGYYDYIRPISAIRYMASQGQSTDPTLPNYAPQGLPLLDGWIELVASDDPLAGENQENVNKVKVYSWRGHDFVNEDGSNAAGVGWLLAENWWPYQRPSFVTPPFAGYVSGHSTFSRAAAEVLTSLTGSAYFPGGVGEFTAAKDEYLVFEQGPSQDIVLQWARYYDASDQCSLSRIWGGIHPPADDIPGRRMGAVVGKRAFALAEQYFSALVLGTEPVEVKEPAIYPNPVETTATLHGSTSSIPPVLMDATGRKISPAHYGLSRPGDRWELDLRGVAPGVYLLLEAGGHTTKLLKK